MMALGAGLIADRWGVTRMTIFCFVALGFGSGLIAAGLIQPGMLFAFFATLLKRWPGSAIWRKAFSKRGRSRA